MHASRTPGIPFAFPSPHSYNADMDLERNNPPSLIPQIKWRLAAPWFLAGIVLSAIVLNPWGPLFYLAGFLKCMLIVMLLILLGFAGWTVLLVTACIQSVRRLRVRRWPSAGLWLAIAVGLVVAPFAHVARKTPAPIKYFAHGFITRLEIRTDLDAVQTWVESLDPRDCLPLPHSGHRGRQLSREQQPEALQHQNGVVDLEPDADGRSRVRLTWDESKAGMWGLVIGHKDTKTPPSDPNAYGELRTELRPGVYFWYVKG